MDGPWQIGHKTAEEYGRLAAETARAMRMIDPTIELVASGSSNARMPTFGAWEATVLDHTYEDVDYISLHAYYEQGHGDRATFLASATEMDAFIDGVIATADHIGAIKRSKKKLKLSFDEWNIWFETNHAELPDQSWAVAPRHSEETYDVTDAVVFGTLLMSLLRHADRVGVACLAQLVNVLAPIRTETGGNAWRQTIFHPFALTAQYAQGEVLRVELASPRYTTQKGEADAIDVVATLDAETGDVAVFAVNRDQDQAILLDVDLRPFPEMVLADHQYLGGESLDATNTDAHPNRVVPRRGTGGTIADRHLTVSMPPVSWTMVRLARASDRRS